MTAPLTGYTSALPDDILLDSGVLYINTTVFGAFAGGLKFDPGVTYRNADFDGKRSPVKGLDRVTMRMPKISGTVIQLSTTNVGQIEPGAATQSGASNGGWTAAGATSYAPRAAGSLLATGDYLSEVRCIWKRGASTGSQYVQVRFPSGLCTKYDITGQDGAEVAIALEIEARLDPTVSGFSNIGSAPFRIEYLTSV